VDGGIGQLTKEIGMDLTSTLLEEDHGMLAQLNKIQVEEFASKIESQMQVVAKLSLKCQKLQSLLKEDNIMKRCQELLGEGVSAEGDACRHSRGSATTHKKRREDLEERQHELDDATRISYDLEASKEGAFAHLHCILSFNVYSVSGYQK
jgi:hypothetical protein